MCRTRRRASGLFMLLLLMTLTACGQQMANQPRVTAYQQAEFFDNDMGMRELPQDVVPQAPGALQEDDLLYTGQGGGDADGGEESPGPGFSEEYPYEITMEDLERGQERYNIWCQPCHSLDGGGEGMVVRRGYIPAPSFHQDRLREQPGSYFFNAITNGFGRMPSYAPWISPTDRWAIAAYVKVLQRSQNGTIDDVPEEERDTMIFPADLEAIMLGE